MGSAPPGGLIFSFSNGRMAQRGRIIKEPAEEEDPRVLRTRLTKSVMYKTPGVKGRDSLTFIVSGTLLFPIPLVLLPLLLVLLFTLPSLGYRRARATLVASVSGQPSARAATTKGTNGDERDGAERTGERKQRWDGVVLDRSHVTSAL